MKEYEKPQLNILLFQATSVMTGDSVDPGIEEGTL